MAHLGLGFRHHRIHLLDQHSDLVGSDLSDQRCAPENCNSTYVIGGDLSAHFEGPDWHQLGHQKCALEIRIPALVEFGDPVATPILPRSRAHSRDLVLFLLNSAACCSCNLDPR